jgi:hypothetical protein
MTIDPKFPDAINAAVLPVLKQFQVPMVLVTVTGEIPITVAVPPPPAPPAPVGVVPVPPTTPKISKTVTVTTQAQVPAKLESGTEYLFARGATFVVAGFQFGGLSDVAFGVSPIGGSGLPDPVLKVVGGTSDKPYSFYSDNVATSRIMITGLTIDSPWTPAADGAGYAYHLATAQFGNVHGTDITLDINQRNLVCGPILNPGSTKLRLNINGDEPLGVKAQRLMCIGADNADVTGTFDNSAAESPFRCTGSGYTNSRINITVRQRLDPAHGRARAIKSGAEFRAIKDSTVHVTAIDCQVSFDTDTTGIERQTNCDVTVSITNDSLTVKQGASNLRFTGAVTNNNGSACVSDSAGMGTGNTYALKLAGAKSGFDFVVSSDVHIDGSIWTPSKPGLPEVTCWQGQTWKAK